jgi:hypothetical protein
MEFHTKQNKTKKKKQKQKQKQKQKPKKPLQVLQNDYQHTGYDNNYKINLAISLGFLKLVD